MKKERTKKEKVKFVDDGRTIYSMDALNPHYKPKIKDKLVDNNMTANNSANITKDDDKITLKEKKVIFRVGIGVVLPKLITLVVGFVFAMLLIAWWLS